MGTGDAESFLIGDHLGDDRLLTNKVVQLGLGIEVDHADVRAIYILLKKKYIPSTHNETHISIIDVA